jgi:tRNA (guanine37-N1)-methyltransferase
VPHAPPWRATVLTLFPDTFPGPLGASLAGRALETSGWRLETVDIRDFARDKHRSVDDHPFGGGPGMVMRPDVLAAAIDSVHPEDPATPFIYLSPRGVPLTQQWVKELAGGPGIVLICGRFEGVDERVLESRGIAEMSIGDYVLSGGEVAAMVLIDACVRLLPGVVGREASLVEESFEEDLLEYPHYTRPRLFEGRAVPDILLSGDHAEIDAWRRTEAERLTQTRRADLWARRRARQA